MSCTFEVGIFLKKIILLALTSETPCNLLQLNADEGQRVIKATNSYATQNTIPGNRNRMTYSTCCGSINE